MARELEDEADIAVVVKAMRRVAVLGIKTEQHQGQAAFYVPEYLQAQGLSVVPVPVYYPEVISILGEPVYRSVAAVPGEIDVLDVFRRPQDIDQHLDDIIAKKPKLVWFQSGIRNDAAAVKLVSAGIDVVQDRCLYIDHRQYAGR